MLKEVFYTSLAIRLVRWGMLLVALGGITWCDAQAQHRFTVPQVISYRDSLRQHIFDTGSAELDCYLSYPLGKSDIYPDLCDNAREIGVLRRFLHYALEDSLLCVEHIRIVGYCSPEGSQSVNDRLAENRANRFFKYLDADYGIAEKYSFEVLGKGADWVKFRQLIAASDYKWRTDALHIIDGKSNPEWKKMQLAQLSGGRAYEEIYRLYPQLRRVEIQIKYDVKCTRMKLGRSNFLKPSNYSVKVLKLKAMNVLPPKRFRPLFALKTNLLFDLAMAPNVEVEVPIGRRWSVNAEWTFPWWLYRGDKYCFQVLSGGLEGRYWLGHRFRRPLLTGHFVGFYAGAGKYDLQWDRNGYQGEFYIASGVSYGYALPIGRRLNLEFSIGLGLLRTDYRHYHTLDNYQMLLWQDSGRYTWLGPTKAKISLVWMLGNKKGGRR